MRRSNAEPGKLWVVDYDQQALEATQSNVRQNHICPEQIIVFASELFHPVEKVDVLIANILAEPLIQLAEQFTQYVKTSGRVVLAGILHEQVQRIQDQYVQPVFAY